MGWPENVPCDHDWRLAPAGLDAPEQRKSSRYEQCVHCRRVRRADTARATSDARPRAIRGDRP